MGNFQRKDDHLWILTLLKVCAFDLDFWKMGSVETFKQNLGETTIKNNQGVIILM